MKYRVVTVGFNGAQPMPDNDEFPGLVRYVDDESDVFVVQVDTGVFYPASEFFYMTNISEFETNQQPTTNSQGVTNEPKT